MLLKQLIKKFSTSAVKFKAVKLKNVKGKSVSSQQWLNRQLSDPYVEKAKMENYRCRSAFKLLEINERFRLFHPGQIVIDCGSSPGSWTQVAVKEVNADNSIPNSLTGQVISIDKQQIFPIQGATILGNMDFTETKSQEEIMRKLEGRKANGVVSDMAPNSTGIRVLDNENIIILCYTALRFAAKISEIDAFLIVKLWQCEESKKLENDIARFYKNVKVVKPNASRSDSAEIFLLGRNFKGLKS